MNDTHRQGGSYIHKTAVWESLTDEEDMRMGMRMNQTSSSWHVWRIIARRETLEWQMERMAKVQVQFISAKGWIDDYEES